MKSAPARHFFFDRLTLSHPKSLSAWAPSPQKLCCKPTVEFPSFAASGSNFAEENCWRPIIPRNSSQDRKSTRLNSNHTLISYAVFCLQKKKPHIIHST